MWTGLPSKTGVGGGIVSIVPGEMAIAAFSPRLKKAGNSVRAQKAINFIAGELGVGVFGANPGLSLICRPPRDGVWPGLRTHSVESLWDYGAITL